MKFEFSNSDHGSRRGRGRGAQGSERRTTAEQRRQVAAWFAGRLPGEWSDPGLSVKVDDDEILVVITLAPVELPEDATSEERAIAATARIGGWRDDTREERMRVAQVAQMEFSRQVSWGASSGERTELFTTAAVPVMTRLRLRERAVLDTLIDAGVARSRSEALAWCVQLVASHEEQWIAELRAAFESVEDVRARGPRSAAPTGEPSGESSD